MDLYDALRDRLHRQHGPLGERLRNALVTVIEDGTIAAGASLLGRPREVWKQFVLALGRIAGISFA